MMMMKKREKEWERRLSKGCVGMYVCTAPTTCVARDEEWNSRGDLNSSSSTHRNTTHIPIHQERKEEVKSVIESIQLTHLAMRPPALFSLLRISSLHVSLTTPKQHGPHETAKNTETGPRSITRIEQGRF